MKKIFVGQLTTLIQDLKLSGDTNLVQKAKIIDVAFESHKVAMVDEYMGLSEREYLSKDALVNMLFEKAQILMSIFLKDSVQIEMEGVRTKEKIPFKLENAMKNNMIATDYTNV